MTQKVSDYVKNMQNNYFKFVFFFSFLEPKLKPLCSIQDIQCVDNSRSKNVYLEILMFLEQLLVYY